MARANSASARRPAGNPGKGATLPPVDAQAEKASLVSIMLEPSLFAQMPPSAGDFLDPAYQILVKAFADLHAAKTPISNPRLLSPILRRAGIEDPEVFLSQLMEKCGTADYLYYLEIVREKAKLRRRWVKAAEIIDQKLIAVANPACAQRAYSVVATSAIFGMLGGASTWPN